MGENLVLKHIDNVKTFMVLASQEVPTTLTIPSESDRKLRAKLILEEAFELIEKGLGIEVSQPQGSDHLEVDRLIYQCVGDVDPVEAIDGAVDTLWVGVTGVAAIFGLTDKLEACVAEVDRSNLSKFIDGHRRDDGKWVKGPSYSPADLRSIIYGDLA
jgi:predicted HAD superfamily Cof-like phosphohydrolase